MSTRKSRRKRTETEPPSPSDWQAHVLRGLVDVASRQPDDLVLLGEPAVQAGGLWSVRVAVSTTGIERAPRGTRFLSWETFTISVPVDDHRPPFVSVDHERFLGVAHVMSGYELCLYLDIAREWDPEAGIQGVLNRFWRWLEDAAGDKFAPDTALYHAVGGVPHLTDGTPTVVVRTLTNHGRRRAAVYLHRRTENRLDVSPDRKTTSDLHVPVVRLRRDLSVGAGHEVLADLLARLEYTQGPRRPGGGSELGAHHPLVSRAATTARDLARTTLAEAAITPPSADVGRCVPGLAPPWVRRRPTFEPEPPSPAAEVAAAILDSVARNPSGSHQYVLLTVPHPSGGARHLLCLRLPPRLADLLRAALADPTKSVEPDTVVANSPRMPMEWCRVSDERGAVTTRRDVDRPVSALHGRVVHVWGAGGLGSWMAEFVLRAGAKRIVVHDPGHVTGGLLVRQDYVENDIGRAKADALAHRLRGIRDGVDVVVFDASSPAMWSDLVGADLLIDATVSRAVTRLFDQIARAADRRVTIAQVATDARSGSLGLATVAAPTLPDDLRVAGRAVEEGVEPPKAPTLTEIDTAAGSAVEAVAALEPYRVFWVEPSDGDEFVPTRGCSVPTFHGSAADLAAVGGSLLNFIALHLGHGVSGTHLIGLPHSGVRPAHQFLPHSAPVAQTGPSDQGVA